MRVRLVGGPADGRTARTADPWLFVAIDAGELLVFTAFHQDQEAMARALERVPHGGWAEYIRADDPAVYEYSPQVNRHLIYPESNSWPKFRTVEDLQLEVTKNDARQPDSPPVPSCRPSPWGRVVTRAVVCPCCRHLVRDHGLWGCSLIDPTVFPQCQCPLGQSGCLDPATVAAVAPGHCQACGRGDHARCAGILCACAHCTPCGAPAASRDGPARPPPRSPRRPSR